MNTEPEVRIVDGKPVYFYTPQQVYYIEEKLRKYHDNGKRGSTFDPHTITYPTNRRHVPI